jgi:hypothetical protein
VVDYPNGSGGLSPGHYDKLSPTGVFEEDIRAKLYSQGVEPDDVSTVLGSGNWPFMGFRKRYAGKWRFFVIPKCLGPDGYLLWELDVIEDTLAKLEIELLPLDRNLH